MIPRPVHRVHAEAANYAAWHIVPTEFLTCTTLAEKAAFLVRYAILAGNSHNTQPWRFHYHSQEQTLDLYADETRALPHSDPENRQLIVSLGCALGTLLVAADYFGIDTHVTYGELSRDMQHPFATIHLRPRPTRRRQPNSLGRYFPAIVTRQMNRAPYQPNPVPAEILNEFARLNDEDCIALSFFPNTTDAFASLLTLVEQATAATQGDAHVLDEWQQWFRPLDTLAYDGVPPFDFPVPQATMSVDDMAHGTRTLFATAPLFLVVSASTDTPLSWLKAGKIVALMGLAAEFYGISQAPWGAVVEHRPSAEQVRLLTGSTYPVYFSRLGYTDIRPHHSPRRPLHEVMQ